MNTKSQTKIRYKKIQAPIGAYKKLSLITSSSSPINSNASFSITNKNYSLFTESKQQLATQSVQNQATFFNEPTQNSSTSSGSSGDELQRKNNNSTNKKRSDLSESRERLNYLRHFYSDPEIDKAIEKPLVRLNPMAMMYMGVSEDNSHLLKSANYLRNEIPIRLAHMIKELRNLPFIVAINPSMLDIHERCVRFFRHFEQFDKEIKDINTEKQFLKLVCDMLEMNRDLLALLCDGFRDSRRYTKNEDFIKYHLNRILSARLGVRLLCEHHIALNKQSYQNNSLNDQTTSNQSEVKNKSDVFSSDEVLSQGSGSISDENCVGIIHKKFSPKRLIETSGRLVTRICMDKYSVAPKLKIDGHTNAQFPYIPLPLEYILPELLKNAFRATCEHHRGSSLLPDVSVTIAMNDKDCIFRIRDRGGGIPHSLNNKIFDYHFTTAGDESSKSQNDTSKDDNSFFSSMGKYNDVYNNMAVGMICEASSSRGLAVMHGYGFGLPTSKAYAEYLGGSLTFQSMQGIGSDFYLRLALLDTEPEMVRI